MKKSGWLNSKKAKDDKAAKKIDNSSVKLAVPEQTPKEEKQEARQSEQREEKEVPSVPKEVVCPRCHGGGIWHSSRTGVRAITSAEPMVDPSRICPECNGKKEVTILITHEQRNMEIRIEKSQKQARQAALNARAAADHAAKVAKEAESKVY